MSEWRVLYLGDSEPNSNYDPDTGLEVNHSVWQIRVNFLQFTLYLVGFPGSILHNIERQNMTQGKHLNMADC